MNCASHRDTVINKTELDSDCRAIIQKSESVIVHDVKENRESLGQSRKERSLREYHFIVFRVE